MLAEASTSTESSGLPGGGGTRSIQVGLSKTTNGTAKAAPISARITSRLRPGIRPRLTSAYAANSPAAESASGTHKASGM